MMVELYDWEVKEAIADYMKKEFNMELNTDHIDCSEFEYQERETVYKKHKNGRVKKTASGIPEIDWKNSPTVTKTANFHEGSKITLYLFNFGE